MSKLVYGRDLACHRGAYAMTICSLMHKIQFRLQRKHSLHYKD